jgi:hypothetical protein
MLAYERKKNAYAPYMYRYTAAADSIQGKATIRAVPRVQAMLPRFVSVLR